MRRGRKRVPFISCHSENRLSISDVRGHCGLDPISLSFFLSLFLFRKAFARVAEKEIEVWCVRNLDRIRISLTYRCSLINTFFEPDSITVITNCCYLWAVPESFTVYRQASNQRYRYWRTIRWQVDGSGINCWFLICRSIFAGNLDSSLFEMQLSRSAILTEQSGENQLNFIMKDFSSRNYYCADLFNKFFFGDVK